MACGAADPEYSAAHWGHAHWPHAQRGHAERVVSAAPELATHARAPEEIRGLLADATALAWAALVACPYSMELAPVAQEEERVREHETPHPMHAPCPPHHARAHRHDARHWEGVRDHGTYENAEQRSMNAELMNAELTHQPRSRGLRRCNHYGENLVRLIEKRLRIRGLDQRSFRHDFEPKHCFISLFNDDTDLRNELRRRSRSSCSSIICTDCSTTANELIHDATTRNGVRQLLRKLHRTQRKMFRSYREISDASSAFCVHHSAFIISPASRGRWRRRIGGRWCRGRDGDRRDR